MKIIMICGSPRPVKSTSQYLLDVLSKRLGGENEILLCRAVGTKANARQVVLDNIEDTDAIVLAFPLYVDGIPGSLLQVLRDIEMQMKGQKVNCRLYVIVNNGFYDAGQNKIAIDMAWKWGKDAAWKKGAP